MIIDKDNIKILLIILVLGLGIGYAYINSDLSINGTAQVNSANWDVHWANIKIRNGSVSGSNVVTPPTISNGTTVNFSVVLTTPGDYYEFTVDAVNNGSIDAMIDSIDSKVNGESAENLPDYLSYAISYSDDMELEQNHLLVANSIETYRIRIKYRDNITAEQLPSTNQTLNLNFSVTYRQANSSAVTVDHGTAVYTINSQINSVVIGQAIPSTVTQYSTAEEAITAYGDYKFECLKHIIKNGVVMASYIVLIIPQDMATAYNEEIVAGRYELRGLNTYDENSSNPEHCKSEYYDSLTGICMSPYYERNKETIRSIFNDGSCHEYTQNNPKNYHYICMTSTNFYADSDSNGAVDPESPTAKCYITNMGESYCVH